MSARVLKMHYDSYPKPSRHSLARCGARNVPRERITNDPALVTCRAACGVQANRSLGKRRHRVLVAARESHGSGVRTPAGYETAMLGLSPAGPLGIDGLRALANALWSAKATLEMRETRETLREEGA